MINYKDPAALRELMAKVTAGPWEWHEVLSLDRPCYPLVSPTTMRYLVIPCDGKVPSQDVLSDEDAQFIALSREALPYWIQQAEAAERAVERLLDALDHGARCPQAGMWDECHDYGDRKCRACRKAWAMKEGK
jgi:hypothetical protein